MSSFPLIEALVRSALLAALSAPSPTPVPAPRFTPAQLGVPAGGATSRLGDRKLKRSSEEASRVLSEAAPAPPGAAQGSGASAPLPADFAGGGKGRGGSPGEPTDLNGKGERYWQARAQRTRDAVRRAEARLTSAEASLGGYEREAPVTDFGRGSNYVRLRRAVDEARLALENARRAESDLAEEARKAGAYPGWLR